MSACQTRRTRKAEGKTKVTAKNRKRIPLSSPSNPVRASGDPPLGKRETQEMGHKRAFFNIPTFLALYRFYKNIPSLGIRLSVSRPCGKFSTGSDSGRGNMRQESQDWPFVFKSSTSIKNLDDAPKQAVMWTQSRVSGSLWLRRDARAPQDYILLFCFSRSSAI